MESKKWIDSNGKFWNGTSIVLGVMRIFNPTDEQLEQAGYIEYVAPAPPEPTAEELLEQAKRDKIQELENYNNSDGVNLFTIYGIPMWLNFDERNRLQKAVDAKEAIGKTEMEKNWNGVKYTFQLSVWKQMLATIEDYAYDCQNVTDGHISAINGLASIDAVKEYDFTTGYPRKLSF